PVSDHPPVRTLLSPPADPNPIPTTNPDLRHQPCPPPTQAKKKGSPAWLPKSLPPICYYP
ncbi:MAG: hypothetical protein LUD52_06070, partial [Opitutae bacterium]|nr:hypothetical protein [Opitutae bacterium]